MPTHRRHPRPAGPPLTLTNSWIWGFSAMLGGGCWLSGGCGKCRSCGPSQPTFLPGVHPLTPTPAPRPAVGPRPPLLLCRGSGTGSSQHRQLRWLLPVPWGCYTLPPTPADGRCQVLPCCAQLPLPMAISCTPTCSTVSPLSLVPSQAPSPGTPTHQHPCSFTGSSYYFFI